MYGDTSNPRQLVHTTNAHKQDDIATELIRIGPLADRTVCQLAVVCAGIMLLKTVLVRELLSQTMSAYVGAPPHHARRALTLAIRERQDTLAFVFLATVLNPLNRMIPGEDRLLGTLRTLASSVVNWEIIDRCSIKGAAHGNPKVLSRLSTLRH